MKCPLRLFKDADKVMRLLHIYPNKTWHEIARLLEVKE